MSAAQIQAEKASRLMEELEPYLSALEEQSIEIAVTQPWQHETGAENAQRALERVKVIRDIRINIQSAIAMGGLADKKEAQTDPGFSPYA